MSKKIYMCLLMLLLIISIPFAAVSSHIPNKASAASIDLCNIEYDDNGYPIVLAL